MVSPLTLSNTNLLQRKNLNTQNTGNNATNTRNGILNPKTRFDLTQNLQNTFPSQNSEAKTTTNNTADPFANLINSLRSLIGALNSLSGGSKSENPPESSKPEPSDGGTNSVNPFESSKAKPSDGDQTPKSSKPKPSDGDQTPKSNKPKPADGDQTPKSNKPKPSDGDQTPKSNKPKPSDGDSTTKSSKPKLADGGTNSVNSPKGKKTKSTGPQGPGVIKPLPTSGKYTQQELIEATGGDKEIIAVLNKMAQDPRGARALRGALDRKTTFTHENIPGGAIGVTGATNDDSAPPYIKMEVLNVEVAAHEIGHAIKFGNHDQIYEFGRQIARSVGE